MMKKGRFGMSKINTPMHQPVVHGHDILMIQVRDVNRSEFMKGDKRAYGVHIRNDGFLFEHALLRYAHVQRADPDRRHRRWLELWRRHGLADHQVGPQLYQQRVTRRFSGSITTFNSIFSSNCRPRAAFASQEVAWI